MPSDQDITLKVLLEHIQALRAAMEERFDRVEKRIDRVEGHMDQMGTRLSTQIANIDQRLDEIEVKRLPALEAKVA